MSLIRHEKIRKDAGPERSLRRQILGTAQTDV